MKTRKGRNLVFVESVLHGKTLSILSGKPSISRTYIPLRATVSVFRTLVSSPWLGGHAFATSPKESFRTNGDACWLVSYRSGYVHLSSIFFNRQKTNRLATTDRVGFEPTGACAHSGFQDRAVMTTSVFRRILSNSTIYPRRILIP